MMKALIPITQAAMKSLPLVEDRNRCSSTRKQELVEISKKGGDAPKVLLNCVENYMGSGYIYTRDT